ncbi:MAG: hypothetical protein ABW221_07595 [Vicinamibacteria bacterium]
MPLTPTAGGQCSGAGPTVVPNTGLTNDTGNTCTPGTPNAITNYGGACAVALGFPYPGPEHIYQLTLGAGNNPSFSANLAGGTGDLALFLVGSATCGDGVNCVANSQDAIGPGAGPELIAAANYPNGNYFLYVDSYYGSPNPASCGAYALTITTPLPAELIQFDIS